MNKGTSLQTDKVKVTEFPAHLFLTESHIRKSAELCWSNKIAAYLLAAILVGICDPKISASAITPSPFVYKSELREDCRKELVWRFFWVWFYQYIFIQWFFNKTLYSNACKLFLNVYWVSANFKDKKWALSFGRNENLDSCTIVPPVACFTIQQVTSK